MFTGLIQGTGRIVQFSRRSSDARLRIQSEIFSDFVLGESIAVNGVCLTVEDFSQQTFSMYASAETLSCTNLGFLKPGILVNLERAMHLGDSVGGHLVSGHVDCMIEVQTVNVHADSVIYLFACPPEQISHIIPKGSVALDGISLTVNTCGSDFFGVNVIPLTRQETTISSWQAGSLVNLETDMIGKYVAKMLGISAGNLSGMPRERQSNLDLDFFNKHGF